MLHAPTPYSEEKVEPLHRRTKKTNKTNMNNHSFLPKAIQTVYISSKKEANSQCSGRSLHNTEHLFSIWNNATQTKRCLLQTGVRGSVCEKLRIARQQTQDCHLSSNFYFRYTPRVTSCNASPPPSAVQTVPNLNSNNFCPLLLDMSKVTGRGRWSQGREGQPTQDSVYDGICIYI